MIVDAAAVAEFREIGRREEKQRYYYAADRWPSLLLVTQGLPLNQLIDRTRVAFFDMISTDSNIVLDQFEDAPERWREMQIVQCSLRDVRHLPPGTPFSLSEALEVKLSNA